MALIYGSRQLDLRQEKHLLARLGGRGRGRLPPTLESRYESNVTVVVLRFPASVMLMMLLPSLDEQRG